MFSEYGSAIWSDPFVWIPEAARVLRPGGELTFLGNSVLYMLCAPLLDGVPAEHTLLRPSSVYTGSSGPTMILSNSISATVR